MSIISTNEKIKIIRFPSKYRKKLKCTLMSLSNQHIWLKGTETGLKGTHAIFLK